MQNNLHVTKRSGKREPLNLEKIHKVITWAAEGLDKVSVSEVELKSRIQFFDGIKTEVIHETIIVAASDLISEDCPDYQYLSARLAVFHLRKKAYGKFDPPSLYEHIVKMTEKNLYDKHILSDFCKDEIDILDDYIQHDRDLNFSYAAIKQLEGKYLLQNRVTKQIFESAQFLYIMISMCLFSKESLEVRIDLIKRFYDAISNFKISLPTPIMAGIRTPTRQFSSCVLIDCDDNLDSINATASSIVKYVSQRAGIGINAGKIRAVGSKIRNGEALHTGCIPFYKYFQTAVKSCSQGGVRGGAATLFYPIWHLEVEDLLILKNNRGVEENRVRHIDYAVQLSRIFYSRLVENKDISLFSPSDTGEMYEAFFSDQELFEALYNKYEQDPTVRKKTVKAVDLFSLLMQERTSTGRIYIQNVDHCNQHSAFNSKLAPIKQSNLCMEITLPTKPLRNVEDEEGEIALCTLSAFNLGKIENLEEFFPLAELVVRSLDNLLDYQNYPLAAARTASKSRRTLGVGVVNLAYYLAKNNLKYSDGSANNLVHKTFEYMQYALLTASNNLAKEKGYCSAFADTNYSQGILPIDTYKKDVDSLCDNKLYLDWEDLRQKITNYGLRNSVLSSLMPSETSSQVLNATNGIEPPRGLVSVKASKDGVLKQVVPEIECLRDKYELLWDLPNNKGYLDIAAIMQKFVDQAISTNTSYDPFVFADTKVPMQVLLRDLLYAYKMGVKTLYYQNTRDRASDAVTQEEVCSGGACAI